VERVLPLVLRVVGSKVGLLNEIDLMINACPFVVVSLALALTFHHLLRDRSSSGHWHHCFAYL
jgi:hypothetical protein